MALVLLCCYLFTVLAGCLMEVLNLRYLRMHGTEVPAEFADSVNEERLSQAAAYALARGKLGLWETLWDTFLVGIFFFAGMIGWYDAVISSLGISFVATGVAFFLVLTVVQTLLSIPFDLVMTFRVEQQFGFNVTTFRLWFSDLLRSTIISLVLVAAIVAGSFALVKGAPESWWLWVWGFLAITSLFLMYLSPYVIEPLFLKFEPVRDEMLEAGIRDLMARAGLAAGQVLQVDASRRSRHSNAYFTGIGRVKRIVLFDTLLQQMNHQEILAVLAHEIGHWKKGHVWRRLLITELAALGACFMVKQLLLWGKLPALLGLPQASFAAQLVIVGFLASFISFILTPISSWLSRRQEREADDYAVSVTSKPQALAAALIKLSMENLANLHPFPLYAKFYYSHPPVVERIRRLLNCRA